VANTLAAIGAGAGQVECTVNGLGERAGNAALEEVLAALETHSDEFAVTTGIDRNELEATSRLVASVTGYPLPPHKPVVGANAAPRSG
ncbi:MAG: 2-isopropylmalate synthase, partial [Gaiellaceae bacterium]